MELHNKCTRCGKGMNKAYYYGGKPFGVKCYSIVSGKKINLRRSERKQDERQICLFDE